MTQTKTFFTRKILIDSVLIIFSVLLALFIDEWRTAYNEEAETKKMFCKYTSTVKQMDWGLRSHGWEMVEVAYLDSLH